jgi:tetratricopeptide (TPR) repeat protein
MKDRAIIQWVGMGAVLLAAAGAWGAPYVITMAGERVEGTAIRAKPDGEIVLTVAAGTRSFLKGQYKLAVADKPADYDKARTLFAQGQADEAIKLLEPIVRDYQNLGWDLQALTLLGQVHAKKGNYAAAVENYEKIFERPGADALDNEVRWAYRQALLGAGQHDKLQKILDDLLVKENRADAARAQMMRGDIRAAQNQLEPAVLDYLRTVVFFKDEPCRAEAMYKAAETLARMRDPRAKEWYKQVIADYPESPFAAQAKGKA